MIIKQRFGHRIILMIVGILMFAVSGGTHAGTLPISLNAGSCSVMKDPSGVDVIAMDGYRNGGLPGNPALPSSTFNILVPPDILWSSLSLEITDTLIEKLSGTYRLAPVTPDSTYAEGKLIQDQGPVPLMNGKNMAVFNANAFFPEESAGLLPYSQMRKWKFARVYFNPVRYNPVTGEIELIKNIRMDLHFQRSGEQISSNILNDRVMDDLAPGLFLNYDQGKAWYDPGDSFQDMTEALNNSRSSSGMTAFPSGDDQPGTAYDYVIITTNAIVSGSSKLAAFVTHKKSRGHSVRVVTETDFGGLAGQAPNHRAEKIRQWLINNYASYSIEYVLLIGNPTPYETAGASEDIPMKMCWPRYTESSYKESPTDGFYADLTGNWDLDGDQVYGEMSDFTGAGGVDFSMEVWVGRIPVYSSAYSALDAVLQKIMDYENETSIAWRKSALLPMSFSASAYDGAPLAEQMKDDYLTGKGYSSWTQYQQGSGACSVNSSYASSEELRGGTVVRDRWAAGDYGVVCWWGHGSQTSASVGYDGCWDGTLFSNTQTSFLDDDHPSFVYQCSCTNAYPEHTLNLAWAILQQGGIATVSATRVSWFNTGVGYGNFDGSSTNSGIGYEYVKRLVQPLPAGKALYEAKLAVGADSLTWTSRLMNQYDFNLYGDPAVGLDSAAMATACGCRPFTENFNDGIADNWINDGSCTWTPVSGVYRMTGSTPATSTVRYAYYNSDSSDFIFKARVRKTAGGTDSSKGIYFRSLDGQDGNNAYIFHIDSMGYFLFYKKVSGVSTWLSGGWTANAAILPGLDVWNTLEARVKGSVFKLYCNGILLGRYTDTSLSCGKAGLKAYDTSTDSDVVEFDDVSLSCGGAMPWVNLLLDD